MQVAWSRVLQQSLRGFGINMMLLMVLHVLPPVAFVCPLATGFAMGWNISATLAEGLVFGLAMGTWLLLLCTVITGLLGLFIPDFNLLPVFAIGLLLAAHLGLFAGGGAMIGGHLARKEKAALESAPLAPLS